MTSDVSLKTVSQSPFAAYLGDIPRNATLQFVCPDHAIKRQQLVYREVRMENF
jgi:hypothetical protein